MGGNIQVSGTQTYSSGTHIVFNGGSSQSIGSDYPSNTGINLIIENANNVSLVGDVIIGGDLTLSSGNLIVGTNQLTLQGSITPNANFIDVGPASDIVINGTSAFGTFPFTGAETLNNFTFDRSSQTVDFEADITINGELALTNGSLDFSGQTLTLTGTKSGSGSLLANSSSTLTITGSGALGTVQFGVSGNTLGTLNLNRTGSGSVTSGSSLNIGTALNLTNGDFNNTGQTLTMINGSTLTKGAGASLLGNSPETTGSFNITYEGWTQSTGNELPGGSTEINNLTINGGPITLDRAIQVNGDVTFSSGSIDIGTLSLTVLGNWVRNSGSITATTGQVIFSGTTSFSGSLDPRFINLQITNGATVTFHSTDINIEGDLLLGAGATINSNSGTIVLDGSANQDFGGGGASINDLTVDNASNTIT